MSKARSAFACQTCGHHTTKWLGRCPDCGAWNTFVEEFQAPPRPARQQAGGSAQLPLLLTEIARSGEERLLTGIGELDRVLGGGVVPGSITLLGGDPGIGKCVTGDTRLLDPASGAYRPMTVWATQKRPVLSMDEHTLKLVPDEVSAFYAHGVKPIVEVKTKLGRTLRCTPSHPVLTPDGWKPVQDLTAGSYVATPRVLPYFGHRAMPEAHIKLMAYILSDGAANSHMSVTNILPEVSRDAEDIASAFGMKVVCYGKKGTDAKQFGLRFVKAMNKSIPDCIFTLPRQQVALFLNRLFTCDGSVYHTMGDQVGICYSSISRRLAEDVQHLLLRFGFLAKIRTKHSEINGKDYTAYELQLLGISEIQRFLDTIGMMGRAAACEKITALEKPQRPSTHRDVIPTGEPFWQHLRCICGFAEISRRAHGKVKYRRLERPLTRYLVQKIATAYPDARFAALAFGDVYWDQIVSITPAGSEEVYDLSVPGSANFVANDLIVHNSTILLRACGLLAHTAGTVLYVSGEESARQIKMRADRLGLQAESLFLLTETNLTNILEQVKKLHPVILVIDSIQTIFTEESESSPGSVTQVRECASRLQHLAKSSGTSVFLVGHVTKEGAIAGPRVLEHMVDTVLYFEGERHHVYRILRAVKNRFGPTNEIGVFEMQAKGLVEVENPSEILLAERPQQASGSVVVASMEGTRPLLVELQALGSPSGLGMPRRVANGVDHQRVALLLAVLEKRLGLPLQAHDVYVNVVGGLYIEEPAIDLGVVVAVVSSLREVALDPHLVVFGEVGLTGEVRAVGQVEARLREATKLGFRRCLLPQTNCQPALEIAGMELCGVRTVVEALQVILQHDPATAPDPGEDEALATAPVRARSWGKRNDRAVGY